MTRLIATVIYGYALVTVLLFLFAVFLARPLPKLLSEKNPTRTQRLPNTQDKVILIQKSSDNNFMESLILVLSIVTLGYILGSARIIKEGKEGIVERFGQYRRSLRPGLNFVIPFVDIVLLETTREQFLEIGSQSAITRVISF